MATFNSFRNLGLALASDSGKKECFEEESRRSKMARNAQKAKLARRKSKKSAKPAKSVKSVMQVIEADKDGNIVSTTAVSSVSTYRTIAIVEGVFVRVSKRSGYMQYYTASQSASGIGHWMNGKPFKGAFLNLCFYNLENQDFGKKRVFNVHIIEKALPDGRVFLMLDLFKVENTKATSDLRIFKLSHEAKGYDILGTDKKIVFSPRS